jgi:uncharacterized protein YodC (DUF2158 family)
METNSFKVTDVVYLLSGGPAMTIYLIENDVIHCTYFDKSDTLKYQSFTYNLLRLSEIH